MPVAPPHWRTLAEHDDPAAAARLRTLLRDEFPAGAASWPTDVSRRRFLELMGASLALAGLAGCYRPPREHLVPYLDIPENLVPGQPQRYATAMPWQGFARGILVETHDGRPTKIEGNPDHPDSLGATDVVTQAAVLGLYDPARSAQPRHHGLPASWAGFDQNWREQHARLEANRGAGFALVTEPTTSPTFLRLVHALLDRWPRARWYQHTSLPRPDDAAGLLAADLTTATTVFAVHCDLFTALPGSIRFARDWTAHRRQNPHVRLHVAEPSPTVTGAMADHRLPVTPVACAQLLAAIADQLEAGRPTHPIARDLHAAGPRGLCLVGAELGADAQALGRRINRALDTTVRRAPANPRSDDDPRVSGDLATLLDDLDRNALDTVAFLDVNPVHTSPRGADLARRLAELPSCLHHGLHFDETARACRWHLPAAHFLESWGDLRASTGHATLLQPAITPWLATRPAVVLLDQLSRGSPRFDDHGIVRATWPADAPWTSWLRRGLVSEDQRQPAPATRRTVAAPSPPAAAAAPGDGAPIVVFHPSRYLADGRWSTNAWLQELPDPFSRLCWGNAAWIGPDLARRHGLKAGDHVRLTRGDHSLELPVWIQPGQAGNCVTLHLGHGRRLAGAAADHGVDVFPFAPTDGRNWSALTGFAPTGRHTALVSTQDHFDMHDRHLVRVVPPAKAGERVEEPPPAAHASFFPAEHPKGEYAWAMAIDLRACLGCQACVIACQAENNIPVVGPEQVALGREMHWIRVDRYYSGPAESPRLLHQPVPCMHCENAPCELVCPVGATVHSSEGLNDMVYNRCVGTRYCSNNCPYKVRRFNFLDFRPPADSPVHARHNPRVTVRERGVMEKCTYCVQRINSARRDAGAAQRRITDGELQTACQQVCPTRAIVFGDKDDPHSAVSALRAHPLHYRLLRELNTQPRTTYLARVIAPLPGETVETSHA